MAVINAVGNALTGSTGSGSFVGATSPSLTTPTLGVASATSVSFGVTAFNDFRQTTFTPTVTAATVGDLSVSYTTQVGYYIRFNTRVFFTLSLVFTPTYTTASGAIRVAGLPFAAANSNFTTPCVVGGAGFTVPGGAIFIYTTPQSGQSYTGFGYTRSAATSQTLNIASFASGSSSTIFINGSYLTT